MVTASAKKIEVERVKLSLLWHQNLMADEALAGPKVIEVGAHQELFNMARKEQTGQLTVPWPENEQQGFWEKYLERWHQLPEVTPREAWRALVPLRAANPVPVQTNEADTSVWSEGFLHPWGATFSLTLTLTGAWPSLADVATRLIELRRDKRFLLDGAAVRLEDVASAGLEALTGLAGEAAPGKRWEPFSVCTVLNAEGDPTAFDPADETNGCARFLQAAASFSPSWKIDPVRLAAEAKVAGKTGAPAMHLVYGTRRGRTIWSPGNFLPELSGGHSVLGCQYRNLVLASVQTEALARFAEDTAARLAASKALSSEHRSQVGCAVRILEGLYEGNARYRSGSLKAQVEQNQLLDPINAVRADQGLPAIP